MPITPQHVGLALLLKRAAGSRFSLVAFLAVQVILDLEPSLKLLGLVPISDSLHLSHTWTTGAVVGLVAAVVGVVSVSCGWQRGPVLRLLGKPPDSGYQD